MASVIHLDTHAVVWLAAGELERFAPFVQPLLRRRRCAISPMVRLELDYLHEIGRIKIPAEDIFQDLATKVGLVMDGGLFQNIVAEAAKLIWTRDPFDRIICASARVAGAVLLTRDANILANEPAAFWDHRPAGLG